MPDRPKILIVDDEHRFRKTLGKLLTARSLEVRDAASGEEALEMIASQEPDVVLLDVKMPGMGGIGALAEIKRDNPDVEVLVLSGHASVDTAKEIIELGGFDYLLKPYSIDDLLMKIDGAMERRRVRAGLRSDPAAGRSSA